MQKIEGSITVNCPIDKMFEYVADYHNNIHWQTGVIAAEFTSPGPLSVGSTYKYDTEFMC